MRRFFVENLDAASGSVRITGPEARHIAKVLRMGRGDRLLLMDGKGLRFQAVITSCFRQEIVVALEKPLPPPPVSPLEIILCQSLLKSRAMDYVIQKTSELGVHGIHPYTSERTVVRLKGDRYTVKRQHWQEIAKSATKQSDRRRVAQIAPLAPFSDLVEQWRRSDALKVVLWEAEDARDLKTVLRASPLRTSPLRASPRMERFVGMVGPEGGFSQEEIEAASRADFLPVSLGGRILRAETAAMALVAIAQYEWGDLSLASART